MSSTHLCIRRTGLVTSVGLTTPQSCAAFRAKITSPSETRFIGADGQWIMAHEVPLDARQRGRRRNGDESRLELAAMFAIGRPLAGCAGVFAGGDRRRMADQGDQFTLALDLETQDAEAVLLVVKRHPLDEAGDAFKCCLSALWHHRYSDASSSMRSASPAMNPRSRPAAFSALPFTTRWSRP